MSMIQMFLKELGPEAQITRNMLQRVPTDKFSWKPHEKSMSVKQLATHIAELPSWIIMALTTDGLDFAANPYQPVDLKDNAELMDYFEKEQLAAKAKLQAADEKILSEKWTLRQGDAVLYEATKADVIRMAFNQIVHHRAQMGVNLRLLNIPIPGSYGPSADEH